MSRRGEENKEIRKMLWRNQITEKFPNVKNFQIVESVFTNFLLKCSFQISLNIILTFHWRYLGNNFSKKDNMLSREITYVSLNWILFCPKNWIENCFYFSRNAKIPTMQIFNIEIYVNSQSSTVLMHKPFYKNYSINLYKSL